ncbi:hypothetical protein HDV05_000383 [Chytridiales sp. JEL 0842]|nr:hypothetical protein HDV05_000383 [Chytridiales sp. JEL 0842]
MATTELLIVAGILAGVIFVLVRLFSPGKATVPLKNYHLPIRRTWRMSLFNTFSNWQIVQESLYIPYGSRPPVTELIISRALASTQLDDVGGRENFDKNVTFALQDVWNNEWVKKGGGSMGGLCRRLVLERCLQDLSLRIRILDHLNHHSEISKIKLPKVIVVVGLPFSGSGHIRQALAKDKRCLALNPSNLQSVVPVPVLSKAIHPGRMAVRSMNKELVYCQQRESFLPQLKRGMCLAPDKFRVGTTGYTNCTFMELHQFGLLPFEKLHEHVMGHDGANLQDSIKVFIDMIKIAFAKLDDTSRRQTKYIMVDGPQHLVHMELLSQQLSHHNGVSFVFTHRDPRDVVRETIKSALTLQSALLHPNPSHPSHINAALVSSTVFDRTQKSLAISISQRALLESKGVQFIDVSYSDMYRQSRQAVEGVYSRLGMEVSKDVLSHVEGELHHAFEFEFSPDVKKGEPYGSLDFDECGIKEEGFREGVFGDYSRRFLAL